MVAIPAWDSRGMLPAIDPLHPTNAERSPYDVKLEDFVLRFGFNPKRWEILEGFLTYRSELHREGIASGFQWLDGSFVEDIETIDRRAPNDIDVVTFYNLPSNISQQQHLGNFQNSVLGRTRQDLKSMYKVDGFPVHLALPPEALVKMTSYWYSMWSHRRNSIWKGFLRIDLAPLADQAALTILRGLQAQGAQP